MPLDLDDYDGPIGSPRQVCTCAGTAPGYPQHEPFCGEPEPDEDEPDGSLQCEQCGTLTAELYDSENYGLLCSRCAVRQAEHNEPGHGLTPGTYGFTFEE